MRFVLLLWGRGGIWKPIGAARGLGLTHHLENLLGSLGPAVGLVRIHHLLIRLNIYLGLHDNWLHLHGLSLIGIVLFVFSII